jgi:ribonucleoside-diphosphate reductase alpha chain
MIQKLAFDEDLELKRYTSTPKEDKPRFDWRGVITEGQLSRPEIKIEAAGEERAFDLAEIADTIGAALTDLLLSRREEEIFTEMNRQFVAKIAENVGAVLAGQIEQGKELKLSAHDVNLLIEKALIENDAYDVAKSLVLSRQQRGGDSERPPVSIRLIRRNKQVVPWNEAKIEIAVRKSFLSLELDSGPAVAIAQAVTDRLNRSGQAFINIEDVQDAVQEEMMRQGHFKVAESYILYRAHRARLREESEVLPVEEAQQDSMIVVTEANGESNFWDGVDLKRRIEYAMIGLKIDMSPEDIEAELRRSIYPEMQRSDLKKTIILNAKALIERDA